MSSLFRSLSLLSFTHSHSSLSLTIVSLFHSLSLLSFAHYSFSLSLTLTPLFHLIFLLFSLALTPLFHSLFLIFFACSHSLSSLPFGLLSCYLSLYLIYLALYSIHSLEPSPDLSLPLPLSHPSILPLPLPPFLVISISCYT